MYLVCLSFRFGITLYKLETSSFYFESPTLNLNIPTLNLENSIFDFIVRILKLVVEEETWIFKFRMFDF